MSKDKYERYIDNLIENSGSKLDNIIKNMDDNEPKILENIMNIKFNDVIIESLIKRNYDFNEIFDIIIKDIESNDNRTDRKYRNKIIRNYFNSIWIPVKSRDGLIDLKDEYKVHNAMYLATDEDHLDISIKDYIKEPKQKYTHLLDNFLSHRVRDPDEFNNMTENFISLLATTSSKTNFRIPKGKYNVFVRDINNLIEDFKPNKKYKTLDSYIDMLTLFTMKAISILHEDDVLDFRKKISLPLKYNIGRYFRYLKAEELEKYSTSDTSRYLNYNSRVVVINEEVNPNVFKCQFSDYSNFVKFFEQDAYVCNKVKALAYRNNII